LSGNLKSSDSDNTDELQPEFHIFKDLNTRIGKADAERIAMRKISMDQKEKMVNNGKLLCQLLCMRIIVKCQMS
jgi:hypothetical protein